MRGQQIIIESELNVRALIEALRAKVDTGYFWLQFSDKGFAGTIEDDGSFDVRVIHPWQRRGGSYTPHLRGRIMPGPKGARIAGRLDYGDWDSNVRWLPLLPALLFLVFALASDSGPTFALWFGGLAVLVSVFLPPLIYSIYQSDEGQLCFLLEKIAEAQREPMSVTTG